MHKKTRIDETDNNLAKKKHESTNKKTNNPWANQ